MQEQEIENIIDQSSFYLDYRPYVRQICQNEQIRAQESNLNRRYASSDGRNPPRNHSVSYSSLRHNLSFRGCSLQWSDFEILSAGLD